MSLADMNEFLSNAEDHAETIVCKLADLDAEVNTLDGLLVNLNGTNDDSLRSGIEEFRKAVTGLDEASQQVHYLKECIEGYTARL